MNQSDKASILYVFIYITCLGWMEDNKVLLLKKNRQLIYCLSHQGTHYLLSPIILRSTLRIIRVRCLGSHSHHGQSQLRQPRINPKGQRSSQAWWILLPQEPPEVSICQVTPKVPVAKGQAGDSCPGGKILRCLLSTHHPELTL